MTWTSTGSATTTARASRSVATSSAPTSTPTTRRVARRLPRRSSVSRLPRAGVYRGSTWPAGEAQLRGADVCCYALTPTEAPIVDRISEHTVLCAGFSGHGFKFAPTVAAAAGDLTLGATPEIDLTPFAHPSPQA